MCGLLSIAENAMVILQPARDTPFRRQSPVTLWHGWRGKRKLFYVFEHLHKIMPLQLVDFISV